MSIPLDPDSPVIYKFTNKHGEKFEFTLVLTAIFFRGDDTNWEWRSLLNTSFNMVSPGELREYAKAIELSADIIDKFQEKQMSAYKRDNDEKAM